jgi:hypothetical protein
MPIGRRRDSTLSVLAPTLRGLALFLVVTRAAGSR